MVPWITASLGAATPLSTAVFDPGRLILS